MGVLSDFFIAKPEESAMYAGDSQFPVADRCQYKRVTPIEVAQLLAILRGATYEVSLLDEFPVVHEHTSGDWWTMEVPAEMVDRLGAINKGDVGPVAFAWANATEGVLSWDSSEFESTVRDLIGLARTARASGKSMYLWNCL